MTKPRRKGWIGLIAVASAGLYPDAITTPMAIMGGVTLTPIPMPRHIPTRQAIPTRRRRPECR